MRRTRSPRLVAVLAAGLLLPAGVDAGITKFFSGLAGRIFRRGATRGVARGGSRAAGRAATTHVANIGRGVTGRGGMQTAVRGATAQGSRQTLVRATGYTNLGRRVRGISVPANTGVARAAQASGRLRPGERIVRITTGEFEDQATGAVTRVASNGARGGFTVTQRAGTRASASAGAAAASQTAGAAASSGARRSLVRRAGRVALWSAAIFGGFQGVSMIADSGQNRPGRGSSSGSSSGFGTYSPGGGSSANGSGTGNGDAVGFDSLGSNNNSFGSSSAQANAAAPSNGSGNGTSTPGGGTVVDTGSGNSSSSGVPNFAAYNQKPTTYHSGIAPRTPADQK